MDLDGNRASLTGSELADLIQAYEDRILTGKDDVEIELFRSRLKALLFDVRDPIKYALRLVDAESEGSVA